MPAAASVDVGIFNAFPKDTELCQAGLALVPLGGCAHDPFAEDGTIVIVSACPEGLGWHSVLGPGTALRGKPGPQRRRTLLLSPGINRHDAQILYGEYVEWFADWAPLRARLEELHGPAARAAVFPAGAMQMAIP